MRCERQVQRHQKVCVMILDPKDQVHRNQLLAEHSLYSRRLNYRFQQLGDRAPKKHPQGAIP